MNQIDQCPFSFKTLKSFFCRPIVNIRRVPVQREIINVYGVLEI